MDEARNNISSQLFVWVEWTRHWYLPLPSHRQNTAMINLSWSNKLLSSLSNAFPSLYKIALHRDATVLSQMTAAGHWALQLSPFPTLNGALTQLLFICWNVVFEFEPRSFPQKQKQTSNFSISCKNWWIHVMRIYVHILIKQLQDVFLLHKN